MKIFITILLILLLTYSIFSQNFFLSPFERAKQAVARWPFLSQTHLDFALALFQTGTETNYELSLGKQLLFANSEAIAKTQEIVNQPQKITRQIDFLESLTREGLQSPEIYRRLSLFYWALYKDDQAKTAWQKAWYLDPNNSEVQEAGKLINQ